MRRDMMRRLMDTCPLEGCFFDTEEGRNAKSITDVHMADQFAPMLVGWMAGDGMTSREIVARLEPQIPARPYLADAVAFVAVRALWDAALAHVIEEDRRERLEVLCEVLGSIDGMSMDLIREIHSHVS